MSLREILASFSIDTSGLKKAGAEGHSAIGKLNENLGKLGTAFAGGIVIEGLKSMVEGLEEQAVGLKKSSAMLGISTQDLQAWQTAARLSGVDVETFNGALKKLEINAGKAAEGGAATGGEFQKLGVHLREDAGGPMRNVQEILHDTGMAIAKLPDPMARAEAVTKTFGKAGAAIAPLFMKGEASLKDALAQIEKLGGGLSDDAIEQLEGMHVATTKWDIATTSLKGKLVTAFLPGITSMTEKLTGGIVALTKTKGGMAALEVGVVALGAAGAAAGLSFIAPWLPAITAFTVLALLVQDFIVGLNGGDSEIGHLIDKLFGGGAGDSFFVAVKNDVQALIDKIKDLVADIRGLGKSVGDMVADPLSRKQVSPDDALDSIATEINEKARRKKRDEDRVANEAKATPHEARNATGFEHLDASVDHYKSSDKQHFDASDIEKLKSTSFEQLNKLYAPDAMAAFAEAVGGRDKLGAFVNVPGAGGQAGGAEQPKTITQTNSNSVSVTIQGNADAGDVKDGVLQGLDASNRAAFDSLHKAAP